MIDIAKQIIFWREGAIEDWAVAQDLVERGKTRHGLFFAHVALEKAIKARVCEKTGNVAPRIHNLVRLAELAAITLSGDQTDTLAEMNPFQIEGRYPESLAPPPSPQDAKRYMGRAEEVFKWLIRPS